MKTEAKSVRPILQAAALVLAFFAASPAIKATGPFGIALAADTPPAVAQPAGAANNSTPQDSTKSSAGSEGAAPSDSTGGSHPADAAHSGTPAADLSYHREKYFYAGSGLRDPFGSLLKGKFIGDDQERLPDIGSVELYGVMWGEVDKFALVEDKDGNGYVLRVGDPVVNGEVAGITRDSLIVRQYFFGTTTTVTLKLKPREGDANGKNQRRK